MNLTDNLTAPSPKWKMLAGGRSSFGAGGLKLSNAVATRDLGQNIRQNWSLNCVVSTTGYKRQQWIGMFTPDMCHGVLGFWDTSLQTNFGGNGFFALVKYDSSKPFATWSPHLGVPIAGLLASPTSITSPVRMYLMSRAGSVSLGVAGGGRSLSIPGDTNVYRKIVLSGNATGTFAYLSFSSLNFDVRANGARGDGVTDDTNAIMKTIAQAQAANGSVYAPAGNYAYSHRLVINGTNLYGDGDSSVFTALKPTDGAMILTGANPVLTNVKITSPGAKAAGRIDVGWTAGVWVNKATCATVQNVTVDGASSVGILSVNNQGTAAVHSIVDSCRVSNTMADGIHETGQSCWVDVTNNSVTNSGDDMYPVVSYMSDGGMSHDIRILNNTGMGQTWGRGLVVVGGYNIDFENNNIQNTAGAGIYLASEKAYDTFPVSNVTGLDNVISGIDLNPAIWHYGIQITGRVRNGVPFLVNGVDLENTTIQNTTHGAVSLQDYWNNVTINGGTFTNIGDNCFQALGGSNLTLTNNTGSNIRGCALTSKIIPHFPNVMTGTLTFTGNTMEGLGGGWKTPQPAIEIGEPESDEVTVSNNTLTGNISTEVPQFTSADE